MTTTLLSNGTVVIDEELRKQAAALVREAHNNAFTGVIVTVDDGREIRLSPDLRTFITRVLDRAAHGAVSVMTLPDELTTTTAAELLGVSRPTLMKLVKSDRIPSKKVGSHTRLVTADVLAFRNARDEKRDTAFASLRSLDDEIDDLVTNHK
ncbi:DNA-binding protein [Cryobacterium sp. TMT1-3]|uniref:DNA-binding protein n=1 Tax=Cryobacterium luteum TaxID=1424661 RepID=A0A1H8BRI7_9MICO|nr:MULTISPECIES: helix-turn-helix domain-containing protein [Cryobacterium]TFB89108.1 DNA-binding protein [Cryobacterium luteum]TFC29555.1 DNA-binding protein [Cryobacterium sp. TMT1-3]SEM85490.1 DNA binding domain-containing protein, excisionase family [Cryobacterium luteum]